MAALGHGLDIDGGAENGRFIAAEIACASECTATGTASWTRNETTGHWRRENCRSTARSMSERARRSSRLEEADSVRFVRCIVLTPASRPVRGGSCCENKRCGDPAVAEQAWMRGATRPDTLGWHRGMQIDGRGVRLPERHHRNVLGSGKFDFFFWLAG